MLCRRERDEEECCHRTRLREEKHKQEVWRGGSERDILMNDTNRSEMARETRVDIKRVGVCGVILRDGKQGNEEETTQKNRAEGTILMFLACSLNKNKVLQGSSLTFKEKR